MSSRSGVSPVPESGRLASPVVTTRRVSGGLRNSASRLMTLKDSMDSMEETSYNQSFIGNILKIFTH